MLLRPSRGTHGLLRPLRAPLARRPTSLASRPSRLASTAQAAPKPSRLTPYIARLRAQYPHAEPRSLVVAFVVLHELTALVPLAILFGAFHYLGAGATLVAWVVDETAANTSAAAGGETKSTWKDTIRTWLVEAENKAERVGRRYGLFGWTKETKEEREERKLQQAGRPVEPFTKERLLVSGDVANAAAAYFAVKALLPLRILISIRLSPFLANRVIGRYKSWRARRLPPKRVGQDNAAGLP